MLTGISIPKLQENILGTTKNTAKTRNCILVQKDARTVVSDGTECYVNVSGNNGMATGGSGDVLTGVIGGLPECESVFGCKTWCLPAWSFW